MIYFDGKEWKVNKYKVTYQTTIYADFPDSYENATVEELSLTSEQQDRLEEIKGFELPQNQVIKYIMDGVELPDDRTETDKLIDLIPIESIGETVIKSVPKWKEGYYGVGRYVYCDGLYKSKKITNQSPTETPENWEKIGGAHGL